MLDSNLSIFLWKDGLFIVMGTIKAIVEWWKMQYSKATPSPIEKLRLC